MQPKEAWGHATAFLERFRRVGWFDFFLLAGFIGAVFGVLSLAGEWREFRPAVHIDLAPSALPRYLFYSTMFTAMLILYPIIYPPNFSPHNIMAFVFGISAVVVSWNETFRAWRMRPF